MRIATLGPLGFCALFLASLWGSEGVGWTETNLKTAEGLNARYGVAPGKAIRIQNLNGPVNVTPSSGADVEVRAQVRYGVSDPKAIRFEVKSGSEFAWSCQTMLANPARPLSTAQHLAKFQRCMEFSAAPLSPDMPARLIETIDRLEVLSDVRLLGVMASGSA